MKSKFEQFIQNQEARRMYEAEALAFEAAELVEQLMEQQKVSKAELARRVGKSKSHVTQLLSGSRNMTLKTLADILFALNCKAQLKSALLDDVREKQGTRRNVHVISWSGQSPERRRFADVKYYPVVNPAVRGPRQSAMVA